jgi:UDP-2-acetamido-2-deoxy-ribo-hexuluronate aminotransferase
MSLIRSFVERRDEVAGALRDAGVPTAVHYPSLIPEQEAYARPDVLAELPHALAASRRVLSLPIHPYLGESEHDHVVAALERAVRG